MRIVPLTLVLTTTLATAAVTSGCGPRQTPEQRVQARTDKLLEQIRADEQQKTVVKAALADFTATVQKNRAVHADVKQTLVMQLQAPKADGAALVAQADFAGRALAETAHAFVDTAAIVHRTLGKEQRTKLVEEMKPGRWMKAGFFMAGRMGYGPPADKDAAKERATKGLERAFDKIDAREAQRIALRPLALGLVDEAAPLLASRQVLADAVLAAWAADRFDATALHATVDKELSVATAALTSAATRAEKAHAILTPEQRTMIAARISESGQGCDHGSATN